MKNSPKHNPTKDVAAPSKQVQQWPANRAGTYTHLPLKSVKPDVGVMSRHGELPVAVKHAGIRASTPMITKPINSKPIISKSVKNIPLRAAQGDDDIMSQEKPL